MGFQNSQRLFKAGDVSLSAIGKGFGETGVPGRPLESNSIGLADLADAAAAKPITEAKVNRMLE